MSKVKKKQRKILSSLTYLNIFTVPSGQQDCKNTFPYLNHIGKNLNSAHTQRYPQQHSSHNFQGSSVSPFFEMHNWQFPTLNNYCRQNCNLWGPLRGTTVQAVPVQASMDFSHPPKTQDPIPPVLLSTHTPVKLQQGWFPAANSPVLLSHGSCPDRPCGEWLTPLYPDGTKLKKTVRRKLLAIFQGRQK